MKIRNPIKMKVFKHFHDFCSWSPINFILYYWRSVIKGQFFVNNFRKSRIGLTQIFIHPLKM